MNLKPSGNFKTDHKPSRDSKMLQSCDPPAVNHVHRKKQTKKLRKDIRRREIKAYLQIFLLSRWDFNCRRRKQNNKNLSASAVCCAMQLHRFHPVFSSCLLHLHWEQLCFMEVRSISGDSFTTQKRKFYNPAICMKIENNQCSGSIFLKFFVHWE